MSSTWQRIQVSMCPIGLQTLGRLAWLGLNCLRAWVENIEINNALLYILQIVSPFSATLHTCLWFFACFCLFVFVVICFLFSFFPVIQRDLEVVSADPNYIPVDLWNLCRTWSTISTANIFSWCSPRKMLMQMHKLIVLFTLCRSNKLNWQKLTVCVFPSFLWSPCKEELL